MLQLKNDGLKNTSNLKMKLNGQVKQISKLVQKFNGEIRTIWENWKPYSTGKSNSNSMSTSSYVEFALNDNLKITSVECSAWVENHVGGEGATLTATIECSSDKSSWSKVASTSQIETTAKGEKIWSSTAKTWSDGCPYKYIRCYSRGNSFTRGASGSISGYQKGSAA